MAKVILGKRPKSFKKIVRFPMLDGTEGTIEMVYIYRTRKEFGTFIDSLVEDGKAEAAQVAQASGEPDDAQAAFSLGAHLTKLAESNADYILKIAEGWNLDAPFNLASVQELADELPGGAQAVMDTYRAAVQEGRLGN